MQLLWPGALALLGLIPLIVVVYLWALRRRRRFAMRFSSLSLVRTALPGQSRLRRHLPFAMFIGALAALTLALGRPMAIVSVPTDQVTIILALDVSGSMRSTDIPPSRLEAAQAAALDFIQRQKSSTHIGIVAFSGYAELIQPPTNDGEALQAAVESLTTGRATAIGSGILSSIDAIAQVDKSVAPSVQDTSVPGAEPTPVLPGAYAPDIIVLLTDGVSNAGPQPLDAAKQAVDRGIRIYTIGYGTQNGSIPFDRGQQGGGLFGNGGPLGGLFGNGGQPGGGFGGGQFGGRGFGGRFRTGIDETTLKAIAAMTGGNYYPASSAGQLQSVFQSLPTYLIMKHEPMEISVIFAAAGTLFAMLAIGLALLWQPLP